MFERILVGTPPSDEGAGALVAAAEMASSYGAELVVLQLEPVIDARRVFDPEGVPEELDHLQPLRTAYPGLRLRSQRVRGQNARTVCQVAEEERSDLIVLPQARRGTASIMLSRRASSALAQRAPCPVLLVAS